MLLLKGTAKGPCKRNPPPRKIPLTSANLELFLKQVSARLPLNGCTEVDPCTTTFKHNYSLPKGHPDVAASYAGVGDPGTPDERPSYAGVGDPGTPDERPSYAGVGDPGTPDERPFLSEISLYRERAIKTHKTCVDHGCVAKLLEESSSLPGCSLRRSSNLTSKIALLT